MSISAVCSSRDRSRKHWEHCAFCSDGPQQSAARVQPQFHSKLLSQQHPLIWVQSSWITPGLQLYIGELCRSLLRLPTSKIKAKLSSGSAWLVLTSSTNHTSQVEVPPPQQSPAVDNTSQALGTGSCHTSCSRIGQSLARSGKDVSKCCDRCVELLQRLAG